MSLRSELRLWGLAIATVVAGGIGWNTKPFFQLVFWLLVVLWGYIAGILVIAWLLVFLAEWRARRSE